MANVAHEVPELEQVPTLDNVENVPQLWLPELSSLQNDPGSDIYTWMQNADPAEPKTLGDFVDLSSLNISDDHWLNDLRLVEWRSLEETDNPNDWEASWTVDLPGGDTYYFYTNSDYCLQESLSTCSLEEPDLDADNLVGRSDRDRFGTNEVFENWDPIAYDVTDASLITQDFLDHYKETHFEDWEDCLGHPSDLVDKGEIAGIAILVIIGLALGLLVLMCLGGGDQERRRRLLEKSNISPNLSVTRNKKNHNHIITKCSPPFSILCETLHLNANNEALIQVPASPQHLSSWDSSSLIIWLSVGVMGMLCARIITKWFSIFQNPLSEKAFQRAVPSKVGVFA